MTSSVEQTARGPRGVHPGLPRSTGYPLPRRALLRALRPTARWVIRRRLDVRLHGSEHLPATGPVILASNHIGFADGPLLAIFPPRPTHALTKTEMFRGPLGWLLVAAGQIPLDRFTTDPRAVKVCLRVLRDGGSVGIFPEGRRGAGEFGRFHRGAAYLALVSGAPVVPVIQLGTRRPGRGMNDLPPRGTVVDLYFGEPFRVEAVAWPRTREQVRSTSCSLRRHMRRTLEEALAFTGQQLPGELPPHQVESDPHTSITDEGAP